MFVRFSRSESLMHVIIFSWEYPPRIVGQLASYVKTLAGELVKNRVQAYVVTYHEYLTGGHDDSDGVKTVRGKKALGIPFVYSVESLEEHRTHGMNAPFNMAIKSIEWLGMFEATSLLVKSEWMRDEVARVYKVPVEKGKVVSAGAKTWIKDILGTYKNVAGGGDSA